MRQLTSTDPRDAYGIMLNILSWGKKEEKDGDTRSDGICLPKSL